MNRWKLKECMKQSVGIQQVDLVNTEEDLPIITAPHCFYLKVKGHHVLS